MTVSTILRIPGRRARDNGLDTPKQAYPDDAGLDLPLDLTPVHVEDVTQQPGLYERSNHLHPRAYYSRAHATEACTLWHYSPIVKRQRGNVYLTMPGVTHPDWRGMMVANPSLWTLEDTRRLRLVMEPDSIVWLRTGWMLDLPSSVVGHIKGRSGLAFKHGITAWHVGTDDARFQGEILLALWNASERAYEFRHGDRAGQLVIDMVPGPMEVHEVEAFKPSPRANNGFASSGR
jgi:dUTP pyrophosphatase